MFEEQRGLEELLVGVLLENVLPRERALGQLLHEHRVPRKQMFFREPRVVNERVILKMEIN